jgi:hypothetical protein
VSPAIGGLIIIERKTLASRSVGLSLLIVLVFVMRGALSAQSRQPLPKPLWVEVECRPTNCTVQDTMAGTTFLPRHR